MDKIQEIKCWAEWNEKNRQLFMEKMEEINQKISQFNQQWWQE